MIFIFIASLWLLTFLSKGVKWDTQSKSVFIWLYITKTEKLEEVIHVVCAATNSF